MLKFQVYDQGRLASKWPLRNAHLVGADHSAMRADITFTEGAIQCQKREIGPAALALQQRVGECGELTIQTTLLPDRPEPYLLSLEQARHRLMLIYNKLEEWSLFDLADDHPVSKRVDRARKQFVEAVCLAPTEPAKADRLAQECLMTSIDASEELSLAHAELLLTRRRTTGQMPKTPVGCGVALDSAADRVRAALLANFDFLYLPTPWRALAPGEDAYKWEQTDAWIDWASRSKMPVMAGPVVSFDPGVLPDWVFMWEHDFETVRDLLFEHIERVVGRYRNTVSVWNVVSGLHVNSHFTFSFDQLMELTRMSTMLVRKLQPTAKVLVEICEPFGEYYGSNPRSIPPLMYADLLVQSGVNFDGFAVKLLSGQAASGQYTRDLMQISHLFDQFSGYGKTLHVTVAAPSEPVTSMMIAAASPDVVVDDNSGCWRKPWSQLVQSRWLEATMNVALSKPFVESVAWQDFVDHGECELPLSGLVSEDLQPKAAFKRLVGFRRSLLAKVAATAATAGVGNFSQNNEVAQAAIAGSGAVRSNGAHGANGTGDIGTAST